MYFIYSAHDVWTPFSNRGEMNRITLLTATLLVAAACGDASPNPIAAEGSRPALTGTGLPNLYVSQITPYRDGNGFLRARIRVCNNGAASAGVSTTRVEHSWGMWYEAFDVYTTNLPMGYCTSPLTPVLGELGADGHSYLAHADHNLVVQESNENDNEKELHTGP